MRRYSVLMLQQLDDFLNVFDSAVCCVSIHEAEREFGRRGGGKIGLVSFVRQHSDLIGFLIVHETLVHIRDDRNDHLHSTQTHAFYALPSTNHASCVSILLLFE